MELTHWGNDIMAFCQPYIKQGDTERLLWSIGLLQKHTPENICLQVRDIAHILTTEVGIGVTPVIGLITHYAAKNASVSVEEIEANIGRRATAIFSDLLRIPNLDAGKVALHTENFIKLLITQSHDVRVILIKLAERVQAMRQLHTQPLDEQERVARLTAMLYAPIAHRLGLYHIKTELEELSVKYSQPDMYRYIANRLQETKADRDRYIADFVAPLERKLQEAKIPCRIKGRPKSISSIWNKMVKNKAEFDDIYDLFAIRIIIDADNDRVKERADCWKAYSLVTEVYQPNPHRLRDWISAPKSSGYESLHTTVIGHQGKWVEVQIRTERMDDVAEKGMAAHWKYKENIEGADAENWLAKIRAALENPNPDFDSESEAKRALYTDEIFIFTPKGDLKKCYDGATVLDFAFAIHTDVGAQCTGAIVNNKFVPISHKLKNGDVVKINTATTQKPRQEWLDIVTSQRSAAKIKRALKAEAYRHADEGKEIVQRKMAQLKVEFNDQTIMKIAHFFGIKEALDFFQAVGEGKIDPSKLKKAFETETEKPKEPDSTQSDKHETPVPKTETDFLLIDTLGAIDYSMARCCNPSFGDDIFGFVTATKGTKIHRNDCPNAQEMRDKYAYRIIRARWNKVGNEEAFLANIKLQGKDQMGIAATITDVLSKELKMNIQSFSIQSKKGGLFESQLSVFVKSNKQLDLVLGRLAKIKDVTQVTRLN